MTRKLKWILVQVHRDILQEFDMEMSSLHASRNEAIRSGMILALESIKRMKNSTSE